MQKTDIEYMTHTWNPIAMRCTKVSDGCKNCWHLRMAKRHAANPALPEAHRKAKAGGKPCLDEKELGAPLRLKKPATIGVQFMGDLFHESVEESWIAQVFGVMAAARHHTFQILTKRPRGMLDWIGSVCATGQVWPWYLRAGGVEPDGGHTFPWPLPNVMLGVSVENQKAADERIPLLLQTPAAVRWISYEPALGPIEKIGVPVRCCNGYECNCQGAPIDPPPYIDWVVAGGESGHGARPMCTAWARNLRDQCQAAGVPFMFKQWGEWAPAEDHLDGKGRGSMLNIGKKAAGRELDGRTWDEYPAILKDLVK